MRDTSRNSHIASVFRRGRHRSDSSMVKNKAEEVERADTIRERATDKLRFAREILINGKKSTWSEFHEALPRKLVKRLRLACLNRSVRNISNISLS